jgi:hypothetical protein
MPPPRLMLAWNGRTLPSARWQAAASRMRWVSLNLVMMLVSGLEQHRCCPTSQSPGEQLTWGGAGRLVPRGSCDDAVALVRREVEWNVQR